MNYFRLHSTPFYIKVLTILLIQCAFMVSSLKSQSIIYKTVNGKSNLSIVLNKSANINAINKKVIILLNIRNGELAISLDMDKFKFKVEDNHASLIKSVFEIDKYPKITFKGNIGDISKIDFSQDNSRPVKIKGDLSIHGITKHVEMQGEIIQFANKYQLRSNFPISINDFKMNDIKDDNGKSIETIQMEFHFDLFSKD